MKIAIAGAGIIGLTCAVQLRRAGHEVTVLDPAPVSGASHFAGGMLAPVAEVVYQQTPLYPLMQAASLAYPDFFATVGRHTTLPLGWRQEGTLVVAADRSDALHLDNLRQYQAAHGMVAHPLPVSQARRLEPALHPRLAGAVSIPGDTQVYPRQWCAALADAARALGVDFIPGTVRAIRGGSVEYVVDNMVADASGDVHTFHADHVVLAAGLGAGHIDGWWEEAGYAANPLQLRPVYGDILRLGQPDNQPPLVDHVVRGFVESRPIYVIPRPDGTIAVGASVREDAPGDGKTPLPNAGCVYELLRDAIRILPGLQDYTLLEASVGTRPGTPDDLPYYGNPRGIGQLTIATGFFRHGILLAGLVAASIADVVAGKADTELLADLPLQVDWDACDPLRHAPARTEH